MHEMNLVRAWFPTNSKLKHDLKQSSKSKKVVRNYVKVMAKLSNSVLIEDLEFDQLIAPQLCPVLHGNWPIIHVAFSFIGPHFAYATNTLFYVLFPIYTKIIIYTHIYTVKLLYINNLEIIKIY